MGGAGGWNCGDLPITTAGADACTTPVDVTMPVYAVLLLLPFYCSIRGGVYVAGIFGR